MHSKDAKDTPKRLSSATTPFEFIPSEKDNKHEGNEPNYPMPGSQHPSAVRLHLYEDEKKADLIITDHAGNESALCYAHGNFVRVESLQTDHVDNASEIRKKQQALIDKLNEDKTTAAIMIDEFKMHDLFILNGNV